MIWTFESVRRAFFGWTLRATTQEPQNGSTQRSRSWVWAILLISPASFVLMPWHLRGGTSGGKLIHFPPRFWELHPPPAWQFPFRVPGGCQRLVLCIRDRFSNLCRVV